jgi:hypothetical protein
MRRSIDRLSQQLRWCVGVLIIFFAVDKVGSEDAAQKLQPCDGGVIQVTSLEVTCDSPYAYYYGNGANRNSKTCNDGDKATVSVQLTVSEDLEDVSIYMAMAVYSTDEMVYASSPRDLCSFYIGKECTYAGDYSFSKQVQLQEGDLKQYVPVIQMAFSTEADGGYNLGGVNIDCVWTDGENSRYDWSSQSNTQEKGVRGFLANYGILIGTVSVVGIFVFVLWQQGSDRIDLPDAQQRLVFL